MASTSSKIHDELKPKRGILKNSTSSSFDTVQKQQAQIMQMELNNSATCSTSNTPLQPESDTQMKHKMKWDEMNILATFHPEGKDYGHMKIDEPPTPYNMEKDEEEDDVEKPTTFDASTLTQKLDHVSSFDRNDFDSRLSSSEDEEEFMTEEQKAKKQAFKCHRKQHYNEFQAVKLARQLMEEEEDEEDEETEENISVDQNCSKENESEPCSFQNTNSKPEQKDNNFEEKDLT